jgi:hypothetical protein
MQGVLLLEIDARFYNLNNEVTLESSYRCRGF